MLKKLAKGWADSGKTAGLPQKPLEESCREEIGEIEAAFRKRLQNEDGRRRAATDSEFWFAVYFPDRAAKDAFLREHGLDKIGDKYLPGMAVDRVLQYRERSGRDRHVMSGNGRAKK
jgi:hypothetical protein